MPTYVVGTFVRVILSAPGLYGPVVTTVSKKAQRAHTVTPENTSASMTTGFAGPVVFLNTLPVHPSVSMGSGSVLLPAFPKHNSAASLAACPLVTLGTGSALTYASLIPGHVSQATGDAHRGAASAEKFA